jgi:hypothetical protein
LLRPAGSRTRCCDQGSHTIGALGLLNDTHAFYGIQTREDQQGVAYPGTFVLDEQGVVVDRRFEQSYRVRPTARLFEEFAFGASGEVPSPPFVRLVTPSPSRRGPMPRPIVHISRYDSTLRLRSSRVSISTRGRCPMATRRSASASSAWTG